MKSKVIRHSSAIEAQIAAAPSLDRRAYVIGRAIDRLIAENEMALQIALAGISVVYDPSLKNAELRNHDLGSAVDNATGQVFGVSSHAAARKLSELRELKSVFDTAEARAAVAKLEPLFVELATARAAEAAAEAAASHARQLVRDELEAKRAALLADLEREESAALAAV